MNGRKVNFIKFLCQQLECSEENLNATLRIEDNFKTIDKLLRGKVLYTNFDHSGEKGYTFYVKNRWFIQLSWKSAETKRAIYNGRSESIATIFQEKFNIYLKQKDLPLVRTLDKYGIFRYYPIETLDIKNFEPLPEQSRECEQKSVNPQSDNHKISKNDIELKKVGSPFKERVSPLPFKPFTQETMAGCKKLIEILSPIGDEIKIKDYLHVEKNMHTLSEYLKGKEIYTHYQIDQTSYEYTEIPQKIRFAGFSMCCAVSQKALFSDKTIAETFLEKYNVKLCYEYLPLVRAYGDFDAKIYYPIETLYVGDDVAEQDSYETQNSPIENAEYAKPVQTSTVKYQSQHATPVKGEQKPKKQVRFSIPQKVNDTERDISKCIKLEQKQKINAKAKVRRKEHILKNPIEYRIKKAEQFKNWYKRLDPERKAKYIRRTLTAEQKLKKVAKEKIRRNALRVINPEEYRKNKNAVFKNWYHNMTEVKKAKFLRKKAERSKKVSKGIRAV